MNVNMIGNGHGYRELTSSRATGGDAVASTPKASAEEAATPADGGSDTVEAVPEGAPTKGVIALLQAGHFSGKVADVRLRISHFSDLVALSQTQPSAGPAEQQPAGTDAESPAVDLEAAPAPGESPDAGQETADPPLIGSDSDAADAGTDGLGESPVLEAVPPAVQETGGEEEPSSSEPPASVVDLGLPDLQAPVGNNGRAYAKFVAMYEEMRATAQVADQANPPAEGPIIPEEGPITPEEGPIASQEGPTTPEEGPIASEEGLITPEEGPITPEEGPVTPEQGPTTEA